MFARIGSIVIAASVIFVLCGVSSAAAKSKDYKATCAGSYTGDPGFSYDGEPDDPAAVGSLNGHDNLGGNFVAQDYAETSTKKGPGTCTAVDGTAGTNFPLVADQQINTYTSGDQIYLAFSSGNHCASNTTSSFSGTETGKIVGGTGKFAQASGSISVTYGGVSIAPASPGFGYILILTKTLTGTVTP